MKKLNEIFNSSTVYKMCSMGKNGRHTFIFNNVFLTYADDCIKYNRVENGEVTREYIASGLYNKFLELREKLVKNDETLRLDCAYTDVHACIWLMCLVRKVLNNLNFTQCGTYEKRHGVDLQGFTMNVKNAENVTVNQYTFKDIHTNGYTELIKPSVKSTKKVTIIDLLKQWENRDSRSEARKVRQFTMYIDEEGNQASEETTIKGNYPTPEQELINKELMLLVNRKISEIVSNCRNFATIYDILSNHEKLSNADSVLLSRFRKYNHLEELTISDLRYLFA